MPPRKFLNLLPPKCYFQHFFVRFLFKIETRASVKTVVFFSVLFTLFIPVPLLGCVILAPPAPPSAPLLTHANTVLLQVDQIQLHICEM